MATLKDKLKKIRKSIIAIGFRPNPNQVTIIGSGFAVDNKGKILTAAHVYNQVKPEYRDALMGMAMDKQEGNGLEHYKWFQIKLVQKDDKNDVALFEFENHQNTLLEPLELGDSEKVDVGDDAYLIGFPYAAQLINDGFGITLIVNKTIISNIKRDGIDPGHPKNWFIIDAISNPGNSGCPLVDLETNKVIGIMTISFRIRSHVQQYQNLDIREPMHIAGAKPINVAKGLLK